MFVHALPLSFSRPCSHVSRMPDGTLAPVATRVRFVFTATRKLNGKAADEVQLQEVVLRAIGGEAIIVERATNPGGASPPGQGASMVIDKGGSKWIDLNLASRRESVLELSLAASVVDRVASYELFTGNDNGRRECSRIRNHGKNGPIQ